MIENKIIEQLIEPYVVTNYESHQFENSLKEEGEYIKYENVLIILKKFEFILNKRNRMKKKNIKQIDEQLYSIFNNKKEYDEDGQEIIKVEW